MTIGAKEVLKINDSLFIVKRILREEYCKDIELLKLWAGADIAFKKEDLIYFCEAIIDLEPETI
jgi:hypothetical protein